MEKGKRFNRTKPWEPHPQLKDVKVSYFCPTRMTNRPHMPSCPFPKGSQIEKQCTRIRTTSFL